MKKQVTKMSQVVIKNTKIQYPTEISPLYHVAVNQTFESLLDLYYESDIFESCEITDFSNYDKIIKELTMSLMKNMIEFKDVDIRFLAARVVNKYKQKKNIDPEISYCILNTFLIVFSAQHHSMDTGEIDYVDIIMNTEEAFDAIQFYVEDIYYANCYNIECPSLPSNSIITNKLKLV